MIAVLVSFFGFSPTSKVLAYTFHSDILTTQFTNEVLLSKKLIGNFNLEMPSIGIDFFVASDEDENFYLPTYSGFTKFNFNGDFLYEVKVDNNNNSRKLTNIIYANGKVIFMSNIFPGAIYIYDAVTGTKSFSMDLMLPSEMPVPATMFRITDMVIDKPGLNVYFLTNAPYRFYSFSLLENKAVYFDLKEKLSTYSGGTFTLPPKNLNNSHVIFVSSKNVIYVFDINNISNYISSFSFANQYSFLNAISSGGVVPFSSSNTYVYTKYQDYMCSFSVQSGSNTLCKKYIDLSKMEGTEQNNPVDIGDDLMFLFGKYSPQGTKDYYASRIGSDIERKWTTKLSGGVMYGGLYKDAKNNLISSASTISILDNENGEVLGTYDMQPSANYYTIRTSLPSITKNGNYYIFAQNKKYSNSTYENVIYKFKGLEVKVVKPCPLNIYCNSTPKHHPVILIHGLGGSYQNFMDEKTGILRNKILEDFRTDDPEFPDSWAYSYSYGYKFDGSYNYQGKIEDISSNLHFDVERLSDESLQSGGDGKVDLIGYSLGGLIARHYILEKTGFPGTQNLDVDTKIGKVVFIASPINGSSLLFAINQLNPVLRASAINSINKGLSEYQGREMDITKDVGEQLRAGSNYLQTALLFNLPDKILFYRNYSDIRFKEGYRLFDTDVTKEFDLGDFAVQPDDTRLANGVYKKDFLKSASVNIYLEYQDGELKLESDPLLKSIQSLNHLSILENLDVINSVISQLKE